MVVFDYAAAIGELHMFLWRYVHENAGVYEGHAALAELLNLEPTERDRLLAVRVLTDPATTELIAQIEALIPALPEHGTSTNG